MRQLVVTKRREALIAVQQEAFGLVATRATLGGHSRTLAHRRAHSLAACASAEGVWRPTIAGASWTSSSFSRASTKNRAKSTRRGMLLSRMGSPTGWLHTGRP